MTKKDITALLIAFSGGWLLVLGVLASLVQRTREVGCGSSKPGKSSL